MQSTRRLGFAAAILFGTGTAALSAERCPTEAEVQSAITHYVTDVYWSAGERQTWKITDVSGFTFGQVKFAAPQFGRCPVRVEYGFRVTHADGRVDDEKMGAGETMYFFLNDFGEWEFRVG